VEVTGLPPDHDLYARAALPAYGRDPEAPLRLLSLSENATYLIDDADPIVLRVHRADYHSVQAIRSELAWMAALREQTDVVTPQLITADDGSEVVTVVRNEHPLSVDAVTFVPVARRRRSRRRSASISSGASPPSCTTMSGLGRAGLLHAVFLGCRHDDRAARPMGQLADAPGTDRYRRSDNRTGRVGAERRLAQFGCAPDRFGLIHADLRMANLMIDPEVPAGPITVIDFDDCGWSWHLADLGAVVSFIEDTPRPNR
jgi:Ser/Thr protein kinase RdoA (MazF antagonist)